MILPVTVYGNPILKKEASPVEKNYEGLQELIANMFETMYHANGLGLAAPQVDLSLKLFVVDTSPLIDEDRRRTLKAVFIKLKSEVFAKTKCLTKVV